LEQSRAQIETLSETVLRAENEIGALLREQLSEQEQQIAHAAAGAGVEGPMPTATKAASSSTRTGCATSPRKTPKATSDIAQAEERTWPPAGIGRVTERLTRPRPPCERASAKRWNPNARPCRRGNELRAGRSALRQAQARAFEAAQQLSRARNEITALDLQKEGNAVRLEKLSAEKIQLEEERVRIGRRGCNNSPPRAAEKF
jgi:hypothetical protein